MSGMGDMGWRDAQERFRGNTEARLDGIERQMAKYEQDIHNLTVNVAKIGTALTQLVSKIAVIAALAAILVTGVVSFVVLWANHHIG